MTPETNQCCLAVKYTFILLEYFPYVMLCKKIYTAYYISYNDLTSVIFFKYNLHNFIEDI